MVAALLQAMSPAAAITGGAPSDEAEAGRAVAVGIAVEAAALARAPVAPAATTSCGADAPAASRLRRRTAVRPGSVIAKLTTPMPATRLVTSIATQPGSKPLDVAVGASGIGGAFDQVRDCSAQPSSVDAADAQAAA